MSTELPPAIQGHATDAGLHQFGTGGSVHGGDPQLFRLQIDTAALVCHLYKIPDHPAYFKAACERLRVDPPSLACRDVTAYYYSLLEPCPAPDEYCPQLDFDFDKKTIMTAPYAELVRGCRAPYVCKCSMCTSRGHSKAAGLLLRNVLCCGKV